MRQLWQSLTLRQVLHVCAMATMGILVLVAARTLTAAAFWRASAALALPAAWLLFRSGRYLYRRSLARGLGRALSREAEEASARRRPGEVNMLRKSMIEAINTIKTSKLGRASGAAALYELPWYMIIGNPSAGKSCAIANAGLHFPIAGNRAIHGVAGTRNCDWFFTTDGILLDTAGRYAVEEADRAEWFGFLGLLRTYRRRAPINGVLLAVSVAELVGANPGESAALATRLRARVQEMTERLGVFVPLYVVFTKVDLVAGFRDFFHDSTPGERQRAWGATLRYEQHGSSEEVLAFFDKEFDALHAGLEALRRTQMQACRAAPVRPGVFTFPREFLAIRPALRAFVATLLETGPARFQPILRGFYFASAVQEGEVDDLSSRRVAGRFDLALAPRPEGEPGAQAEANASAHAPGRQPFRPPVPAQGSSGFFLHELFRNIVFADKDLVARYRHPAATRLKYGALIAASLMLCCLVAGWTWSTVANRQLVETVRAHYLQVRELQRSSMELDSRMQALEVQQERLEQLERLRKEAPLRLGLGLGLGLYQGDRLELALREDYLRGMNEVVLGPVLGQLDTALANLAGPAAAPGKGRARAVQADGYDALKTYLMLADRSSADPAYLQAQMARFWRRWLEQRPGGWQAGSSRREPLGQQQLLQEQLLLDALMRRAQHLLPYYLARIGDPGWAVVRLAPGLRDSAHAVLKRELPLRPALAPPRANKAIMAGSAK